MNVSGDFEVRNLHFTFDDTIPKHWHGGDPLRSAVFNSQSLFFPAGERLFVDSIKHYLPRLEDPQLRRQARLFCGQEAVHQREHENYNRMLQEQGYPAERLQRWVGRFLGLLTLLLRPRSRLAVTCALEHFTAVGAGFALTDPQLLEGAEPRMAAFWRWHAGEETEHRAVPFDVYRAMGGKHLERVLIMFVTTIIFQVYSIMHLICMLWADGSLFSTRTWREFTTGTRPFSGHGFSLRKYLAYYRSDFHPTQLDAQPALTAFQAELAASPVYADAEL